MSSREIAELTDKDHKHVMRDIRIQYEELGGEPKIGPSYLSSQNKPLPTYVLTKRETMTLLTGYSIPLRAKVIDRWAELEDATRAPAIQVPRPLAQALRLAADQAETIEKLEGENAVLRIEAAPVVWQSEAGVHGPQAPHRVVAEGRVRGPRGRGEDGLPQAHFDQGIRRFRGSRRGRPEALTSMKWSIYCACTSPVRLRRWLARSRSASMFALELVIDLPFLAGEINDAHRQVTVHARGMLLEAKRAGDALLAAKAKVKHGEFKAWVEGHTRLSDRTSQEYMRVSKLAKNADLRAFEGGVRAFLEAHAKPRAIPTSTLPPFTAEDAERLL